MGYILPITQHTYKNYQYRMLESKNSPYYVGKPYRVILQRMQRNRHGYYTAHSYEKMEETISKQGLQQRDKGKERQHYYMEQQKKAELTGKGSFMNEQI